MYMLCLRWATLTILFIINGMLSMVSSCDLSCQLSMCWAMYMAQILKVKQIVSNTKSSYVMLQIQPNAKKKYQAWIKA
jgi:hypothetical protein